MEKVQIASWAEIADRMPRGDLFIQCVDGRQKKKIKDILGSTRIANLSDDKLSALLDELEELNVLRKVDKDEYIFNRYSFYSMLGGTEKIEKALSEYEEK